MAEDGIIAVTREIQHAGVRAPRGEAPGQLAAPNARHHHVGQQQVDLAAVGVREGQCLGAGGCIEHGGSGDSATVGR